MFRKTMICKLYTFHNLSKGGNSMKKTILTLNVCLLIAMLSISYVSTVKAECREPGKSQIQEYYQIIHQYERNIERFRGMINDPRKEKYHKGYRKEIRDFERTIKKYRKRIQKLRKKYC